MKRLYKKSSSKNSFSDERKNTKICQKIMVTQKMSLLINQVNN